VALLCLSLALLTIGCEPPPTTQPATAPDTQPDDAPVPTPPERADMPAMPRDPPGPMIQAGPPPGVKPALVMPGEGAAPADGTATQRHRAAVQAAIMMAIYNVTKEINPAVDRHEKGDTVVFIDHFRYHGGLEVRGELEVLRRGFDRHIMRFDVWLMVPGPGEQRTIHHLRNFTLMGAPLTQAQLDALLAAADGHLVVLGITGPNDRGLYKAEVGLIRNRKD
jgi:hypothetical protein